MNKLQNLKFFFYEFFINQFVLLGILSKFSLLITFVITTFINFKYNRKLLINNFKSALYIFLPFILTGFIFNIVNGVDISRQIKFLLIIIFIFISVSIATFFYKNILMFKKTLRMLFYLNIFIFLDLIIFKISNFSIILDYENHLNTGLRYASIFFDEKILGFFVLSSMPVIILYLEKYTIGKDTILKKYSPIILGIFIFEIYLTGERRSFLLSLLTYLLYMSYYFSARITLKKYIAIFLATIIFILTIFYYNINNSNLNTSSLNYRMTKLIIQTANSIPILLKNREDYLKHIDKHNIGNWPLLYIDSFNILKKEKKSILLGIGYKKYNEACAKHKLICSTHPHNMYLEVLITFGIVGFIFFCSIFFFIIKNIFKFGLKSNIYSLLFIFSYFFPFLPSGSIFSFGLIFFLVIFSSFLLTEFYNLKKIR
jgi:hypothetical protein